jgi:ATP-dependent RNA helicase SUPV3L1/SUV3
MLERLADMLRGVDTRGGFEATGDMLSITGMTLEQFADLMGGLGYTGERGEREKVKAVADAAAPVEEKPASDADAAESAVEVAAEEVAPVEEAPAAEAPVEAADVEMEVFYTFRWVPKKRPADQGRAQRPPSKGGAKGKGKKPQGGNKPKVHSSKPKPAKDKPVDPDNPFAALMALKGKS